MSMQSNSSLMNSSGMDEGYIKKNIQPRQRGQSAIFGDSISSSNQIILHSSQYQEQMERSKGQQSDSRSQSPEQQHKQSQFSVPAQKKEEQIIEPMDHSVSQQPLHISESVRQAHNNEGDKLKLKLQKMGLFISNNQQFNQVVETIKANTKTVEAAYNCIKDQNAILNQFKEDTSRKLEENIKETLKNKMDQINRENTKEVKDIKNMTLTIREHLDKNDSKLQRIEKNIEQILALLKSKK